MSMPARSAASFLIVATFAVAWATVAAGPAAAEPGDSDTTIPAVEDSTVLPIPISAFDRIWNQFVPPNSIIPQSPVDTFGQYVEQFFPIFREPATF